MSHRYMVISCSLNPNSRSRILAESFRDLLTARGAEHDFLDLARTPLPLCDGGACYGDGNVREVKARLMRAHGYILATPIYNFDVNATAKNLVELTGRDCWSDKVAGFMCAAGGQGSYMSPMALANSLMLDFRTVIIPRFVYSTGADFTPERTIGNPKITERIEQLADELIRFTTALVRTG